MMYRIDATPIPDETRTVQYQREATIVLVGCGGTGGFLADSICRLLIDRPANLYLVDPDRVEPHNVARQAFDLADVGHFKAEVLAIRLARRFGREIGYSVLPYDHELHAQVFDGMHSRLNLLVGCVDNSAARRAIAATLSGGSATYGMRNERVWWLDCGNGRNAGQVLLGNATQTEGLRHAFNPHLGVCRTLPAPSLQRPDLLESPPEPGRVADCAEAIAHGDQGPTINQVVAAVAASYVEKLLSGMCCWMASYFDLDAGTLRCVLADHKIVAEIAGLHMNAVAPPARDSTRA
jgi:PRTRC genetic system ThiF family protein